MMDGDESMRRIEEIEDAKFTAWSKDDFARIAEAAGGKLGSRGNYFEVEPVAGYYVCVDRNGEITFALTTGWEEQAACRPIDVVSAEKLLHCVRHIQGGVNAALSGLIPTA